MEGLGSPFPKIIWVVGFQRNALKGDSSYVLLASSHSEERVALGWEEVRRLPDGIVTPELRKVAHPTEFKKCLGPDGVNSDDSVRRIPPGPRSS